LVYRELASGKLGDGKHERGAAAKSVASASAGQTLERRKPKRGTAAREA
jgi:hypothetical protein